jgi:hypothetical protein
MRCVLRIPPNATPSPTGSFRPAPSALNREAADLPALPSASAGNVDTGPTEIVIRPTGLRHGKWEAPQWAFWTMGAIVVLLALVYALIRLGTIDPARFRRKKT